MVKTFDLKRDFDPADALQCKSCGHFGKEHIQRRPKRNGLRYYQIKGKHRFGGCSHAHGIPGCFCTCEQFIPTKETVNISDFQAHMLKYIRNYNE